MVNNSWWLLLLVKFKSLVFALRLHKRILLFGTLLLAHPAQVQRGCRHLLKPQTDNLAWNQDSGSSSQSADFICTFCLSPTTQVQGGGYVISGRSDPTWHRAACGWAQYHTGPVKFCFLDDNTESLSFLKKGNTVIAVRKAGRDLMPKVIFVLLAD